MDRRLRELLRRDTSVDEVHDVLMQVAAERANADPGLPREVFPSGSVFWASPEHSRRGGLCISYGDAALAHLVDPERSELVALMQDVGRDAIRSVVRENSGVIARLVLAEARQGRDYAARFR